MNKKIQLWVQWGVQDAENPRGLDEWQLIFEGSGSHDKDIFTLIIKDRELTEAGHRTKTTCELEIEVGLK